MYATMYCDMYSTNSVICAQLNIMVCMQQFTAICTQLNTTARHSDTQTVCCCNVYTPIYCNICTPKAVFTHTKLNRINQFEFTDPISCCIHTPSGLKSLRVHTSSSKAISRSKYASDLAQISRIESEEARCDQVCMIVTCLNHLN